MHKGQILGLAQLEHVTNEKRLLAMCDHPFLIKLAATYQDASHVYMLLELSLGGELFTLLRKQVCFDEPTARFYAANVCAAFEYLHDRKIVYRDLKPENLLLDELGYLKVVDFGFAKVLTDRTWTLCGTPDYLAPEIITNQGHGLSVDWWTFGVLLYELLVGEPPFVADDPMETYQNIQRGEVEYPPTMAASPADLISRLLIRASERLGNLRRGDRDVGDHAFFSSVDFNALEARQIPAPHVPPISDPLDTSNFEPDVEDESNDWDRHNDLASDAFADFAD